MSHTDNINALENKKEKIINYTSSNILKNDIKHGDRSVLVNFK